MLGKRSNSEVSKIPRGCTLSDLSLISTPPSFALSLAKEAQMQRELFSRLICLEFPCFNQKK
jgi:hypothetical protein